MVGAGTNVKLPEELAVPPGAVIVIFPVVPLGTTAVIVVEFTTVKEAAGVPPKLTAVAPVKTTPLLVTVWPVPADVGVNEAMVVTGDTGTQVPVKINPVLPDTFVELAPPLKVAPPVAVISCNDK